jgi:hypothetical protein
MTQEKPMPPWEVYFSAMRASQHRHDNKAEFTLENVEYILFLADQHKAKHDTKWKEAFKGVHRRSKF